MYYRLVAIGLTVALHLAGAIHYRPLWIGVVAAPLCLHLAFEHEARRIQDAAYRRIQEIVLHMPCEHEE